MNRFGNLPNWTKINRDLTSKTQYLQSCCSFFALYEISLLDMQHGKDYHKYGKTNRSYKELTLRTLKGEEL